MSVTSRFVPLDCETVPLLDSFSSRGALQGLTKIDNSEPGIRKAMSVVVAEIGVCAHPLLGLANPRSGRFDPSSPPSTYLYIVEAKAVTPAHAWHKA